MSAANAYLSIREAGEALRRGDLSTTELVQAQLAQLDRWETTISPAATRLDERAMARAQQAGKELESGRDRGPLHGIPVTIKDLVDVADVPMEAGSRILAGNVPERSAFVAERLEEAGAIVLAKARTHEFAWGGTTPPTRNPWDPSRIPGGSSGGSAAGRAAGIGTASIGSDSAGSVRSPASFNGVVGHKPTYGLIGRSGLAPMAWSLDTVGVLARAVEDVAIVLDAVAGPDSRDPTSVQRPHSPVAPDVGDGVEGLRVGVPERPYFDATQADVEALQRAAIAMLADAGAEVAPIELEPLWALEAALTATFVIGAAEAAAWHRDWLDTKRDLYTAEVLHYLEAGRELSAVTYLDAQRVRRVVTDAFANAFRSVDILATPTHTHIAPRVDEEMITYDRGEPMHRDPAGVRCLCAVNLAGGPAASVPVGLARGLPVALHLIGPPLGDATVLRAARAVEARAAYVGSRPPEPSP